MQIKRFPEFFHEAAESEAALPLIAPARILQMADFGNLISLASLAALFISLSIKIFIWTSALGLRRWRDEHLLSLNAMKRNVS
jgi:hypothetical protein